MHCPQNLEPVYPESFLAKSKQSTTTDCLSYTSIHPSFLLIRVPIYLVALRSTIADLCPHYSLSVFFNPLLFPFIILHSSRLFFRLRLTLWSSLSFTLLLPSSSPRLADVKCDSRSIEEVWSSTHTQASLFTLQSLGYRCSDTTWQHSDRSVCSHDNTSVLGNTDSPW